jgi:hypothetical protein
MTRDDIIRMAREACDTDKVDAWHNGFWTLTQEEIERFAALVAAAEREAILKDGWRQCAKDQRTTQFCGMLQQAVLTEREACAKVCQDEIDRVKPIYSVVAENAMKAIRARGQA